MATLLLVFIYIAFIGLGLPDSLFGTAWPAIYKDFNVPIGSAGYITLLICCCTVISSLLSARVTAKFGTGRVTAVSTLLAAVGLFGFSVSQNMWWFVVFAVPLGLGGGAVDSALNAYLALHYNASQMSFLHCFYGVGVSLSPYLMSLALAGGHWRTGYRTVFFIQLGIAAVTFLSLPLWKKLGDVKTDEKRESLTLKEISKIPGVKYVWLAFFASCAYETVCGLWGSTFLVETRGLSADSAALVIMFYYSGVAVGRFISGVIGERISGWKIIFIGQAFVAAAIVMLFLPLGYILSCAALFLVGFGNGQFFPNLIHLTPANFGDKAAPSVIGTQMAASYIGIMLMPTLFGQAFDIHVFPYYVAVLYAVLLFALIKGRSVIRLCRN